MCGYNKCFAAMDFHHIDPGSKKSGDPGKMIYQWSWDKIVDEISKCILVCCRCHREIHFGQHKIEALQQLVKPILTLRCVSCGREYNTKSEDQIYCSQSCAQFACRRVERPSREELCKLVWEIPTVQLANKFGVSDKSIEKWCRGYKIDKPPRGYWQKLKR